MKRIVLLLVVVAVGLVAFNYFTTGELRLLPAASSPQAQELSRLQRELRSAVRAYRSTAQGAAVSGVDLSAEATALRREARRIEKRVLEIQKDLTSDRDRAKAQELLDEIQRILEQTR
jgi:hypothetical protein